MTDDVEEAHGERSEPGAAPPREEAPGGATAGGEASGQGAAAQIREFVATGVFWATLLIVLIAGAIVAVVVQNTHDVAFEFLWLDAETPLLTVILFTSLVSVLGVEVATAIWRHRRRRALNEREQLRRLRGDSAGRSRWRRR